MIQILAGYEIGTGKSVSIEATHMVVTGVTNKSGKTTLLEGLASRGESQKFLVFRSKPDEQVFKEGHFVKPFLQEQSDWRYMKQLLESSERMKLKFETWHIMEASKNTSNLGGFYQNCADKGKTSKREMDKQIFQVLAEYAKTLIEELKDVVFTREFPELRAGINVMDLSEIEDEDVQSIIIRSTLDYVLHHQRAVITIIPELWKFSPQGRNNPVKESLQALVRQGAAKRNFVWVDSQDMSGTDKIPLKQCYTWILGLQTEINEAEHTLDQINLPPKTKPKPHEIASLSLGQFFLSTPKGSVKFYALPKWLKPEIAIRVATGKMDAEAAFVKYAPKDQTEEMTNPVLMQQIKEERNNTEEERRARVAAEEERDRFAKALEEMRKSATKEPERPSSPILAQRPNPAERVEELVPAPRKLTVEVLKSTEGPPPSENPRVQGELTESEEGLTRSTKRIGTLAVAISKLDSDSVDVKILYVMKLKNVDVFPAEVSAMWPDYAWIEDPHTIANHMNSMFKSGLISKKNSGRYFLAPKVDYSVTEGST